MTILSLPFVKELLIVFLIFAPVEYLFPINSDKKLFRRLWSTDLLHLIFTGLLIAGAFLVMIKAALFLFSPLIPAGITKFISNQHVVIQFFEILIIADLGFYFIHRAFHKIPMLWKFHAIHHSIEDMDSLAGHRVHPVDQILTRGVPMLPIFLLDFSLGAFAAFVIFYHWQSLLIHSNINLRLDFLRYIIALPPFHHWHHANEEAAIDRNFAGQLPVLDLIFKTHYHPESAMPERYGTDDKIPDGYVDQIFHPFKSASEEGSADEMPAGGEAPNAP